MSPLKSIAASILLQKLVERQLERRRSPAEKAFRALAVLLGIAAVVFLMIAGYRWLGTRFDTIQTPAVAAAALLAVALAGWSLASVFRRQPQNAAEEAEQKVVQAAKDLFADVENDLGQSVKDHPRAAVSLAALVGFLLARRIL